MSASLTPPSVRRAHLYRPRPRSPRGGWARGCDAQQTCMLDAVSDRLPDGHGNLRPGKSSLVSQALPELVSERLGQPLAVSEEDELDPLLAVTQEAAAGRIASGMDHIRRLVQVDQKPIGRTPRSNLATYLFDHVRRLFADTPMARRRHYSAGRFSFNVAEGAARL